MKKIKMFLPLFLTAVITTTTVLSQTQKVVTETDVVRLPEDATPPAGQSWVGYFRTGTPAAALQFVSGPGSPPLGCGSAQFSTLNPAGTEKVQLFNFLTLVNWLTVS
jgi:hypothetical protein